MKRLFYILVCLLFNNSITNAQCPFSLGPDMFLCAANPAILNGPGGAGVLSYNWSNGQTTQTIIVTTPGPYWLLVTDTALNTCSDTILMLFSTPLNVSLICINNSCTQCTDGSITATPVGGAPPYNYFWSNGAFTNAATNLSAGTYTVTVTDVSGCSATASCEILTGPVGTGSNLVSGNVFFDLDSNGIKGPGETGVPYVKIRMSPDNLICYTDTAGDYGFLVDTGSHTAEYLSNPGLVLTSGTGIYNIVVTSGNYPGNDFSVKGQLSGGIAISFLNGAHPRCGNTVPYTINTNVYCNSPYLNGYIKLIIDSALIFNSANPAPSSVNGDTLSWNFTANAGINQLQYLCYLQIPSTPGYSFNTVLETELLDTNSAIIFSDFDTLHQTVACSFDPNDKSVEPEGYGPQHYVFLDISPTLDYTIRFQNTGNDTAYNVVILDTLDQAFDLNTFTYLGSSHPVQITQLNRLVEFRFDDIYLPDSNVNEPASHGFVRFNCTPVFSGFSYPLENSAAIYFDSNTPVLTNTTLSTIDITVGIKELNNTGKNTLVIPNPFSEKATIIFENPLQEMYELSIYDLSSRLIGKHYSTTNTFEVNSFGMGAGIYHFRIQNVQKTRVLFDKFVVTKTK